MKPKNQEEPNPIPHDDFPHVWDLVVQDMKDRDDIGFNKYHCHLTPNNGRRPLWDAYFEVLDLAVYLRQELYERYGE